LAGGKLTFSEDGKVLAHKSGKEIVNVVWQALTTEHRALSISSPLARRYPEDVVPFAALSEMSPEALAELRGLMRDGEETYVAWNESSGSVFPLCAGVDVVLAINAVQMFPTAATDTSYPDEEVGRAAIEPLTAVNGPEMVALTDVAFPGFFRPRTYRMGHYWGIRSESKLIAMAGERLALPGLCEISAVCTHPGHTGHGHAARLIRHVLAEHAAAGLHSFLHVSDTNLRAIALYERLGFVKGGVTRCTRIRRIPRV
jgi:ribosomal protein S18 acetylase RimI-like enzyme